MPEYIEREAILNDISAAMKRGGAEARRRWRDEKGKPMRCLPV